MIRGASGGTLIIGRRKLLGNEIEMRKMRANAVKNAVALLEAANLYDVPPLKRACGRVVVAGLTPENCVELLETGRRYDEPILTHAAGELGTAAAPARCGGTRAVRCCHPRPRRAGARAVPRGPAGSCSHSRT